MLQISEMSKTENNYLFIYKYLYIYLFYRKHTVLYLNLNFNNDFNIYLYEIAEMLLFIYLLGNLIFSVNFHKLGLYI